MAKPVWRRAFDTAERAVAPHLEAGVQSGGFTEAVVLVQRTRNGVYSRLERDSRRLWHLLNLPAGSDVRRLRGCSWSRPTAASWSTPTPAATSRSCG